VSRPPGGKIPNSKSQITNKDAPFGQVFYAFGGGKDLHEECNHASMHPCIHASMHPCNIIPTHLTHPTHLNPKKPLDYFENGCIIRLY
jgi:hypothetical protein